jgi:hypothetical protein
MYESGNWDVDQRMPSNLLTSLIDHTGLRIDPGERIIPLADPRMLTAPFCYLSGHKLVEFNPDERRNFEPTCGAAASSSSTTATTTSTGCSRVPSRRRWRRSSAPTRCASCRTTASAVFELLRLRGPPATSFELNGWGDDLVHDYLKGIEIDGRLGVLYSNKDYGCEWDYDWRNKRWLAEDNTRFAVNIVMYALNG